MTVKEERFPADKPAGKYSTITAASRALDEIPAQQVKRRDEHQQHAKRRKQRHVVNAEEAVVKAANHVDDRFRVRQPLPERRQQRQLTEHPAEVGQRRQHEGRDQPMSSKVLRRPR